MNNEPVAWAYESKNVDGKPYLSDVALKPLFGLVTRYGYKEIPLYTTPQHASDVKQIKELSDEEILNVALNERIRTNDIEDDWGNVVLEFAKAILKKASEK